MGMPLVKAIARLYSKRLEQVGADGEGDISANEDVDVLGREAFDRLVGQHVHLFDQLCVPSTRHPTAAASRVHA